MKKQQKTFYGSEDRAYTWIDCMRRAHDVKRVMVTEKWKKWEFYWKVEVFYKP